MSLLPLEIINLIVNHLDRHEILTCMTVCKAWYGLFIRVLYKKVHLSGLRDCQKFIMAITTFTNVHEALAYVEEMKFFEYMGYGILHLLPALLESEDICLRNLKGLTVCYGGNTSQQQYLALLYKHRLTLTHVRIYLDNLTTIDKDYNGIIEYINAFPHLTELSIPLDIRYSPLQLNILTHLNPTLLTLSMCLYTVTQDDISAIKQRCHKLVDLDILVEEYTAEAPLVDIILTMKHLRKATFTLCKTTTKNIMDMVASLLSYNIHSAIKQHELIIESCRSRRACLEIEYTTQSGVTFTSSKVKGTFDMYNVLSMYGPALTALAIRDEHQFDINRLNFIANHTCTHLQWLQIGVPSAKINLRSDHVFDHIHELSLHLSLENEHATSTLVKQIERSFLYLQRMEILLHIPYDLAYDDYRQYVIQLPELNIKNFCILRGYNPIVYSIVVVKMVEGVMHRLWVIDRKEDTYGTQIYSESLDAVLGQLRQPLIILASTSVESCTVKYADSDIYRP